VVGSSPRPTREQLEDARSRKLADVVAPGLSILFVGINPGLYSAAVGHNFGRPGNRFWPALAQSGLTPRLFAPHDERALLDLGLGITNIVDRTTARAEELSVAELREGARKLARKVVRLRPRIVAVLGISAYRSAFDRPRAQLGPQPEPLGSVDVWVLPNPSGLNAHHQLPDLVARFAAVGRAAGLPPERV
jgi:double-stranded uracil-DNA glycosylase